MPSRRQVVAVGQRDDAPLTVPSWNSPSGQGYSAFPGGVMPNAFAKIAATVAGGTCGALGPANVPESFVSDPAVGNLLWYDLPGYGYPSVDALRQLVRKRGIGRFVTTVDQAGSGFPSRDVLAKFGTPEQIDDAVLSPACGRPPIGA